MIQWSMIKWLQHCHILMYSHSASSQGGLSQILLKLDGWRLVMTADKGPGGTVHAGGAGKGQSLQQPPADDAAEEDKVYEDFDPLLMQQHAVRSHMQFDTFDAAVDEFFSKVWIWECGAFCPACVTFQCELTSMQANATLPCTTNSI